MEKDNRVNKGQKLCAYSGFATMALWAVLLIFFEIMHHFLRAAQIGTYEIIVSYISILFFVGIGWMVLLLHIYLRIFPLQEKNQARVLCFSLLGNQGYE
ncbi:MAG: hypothetical protein JL50_09580 [Peptococcaceae bacterium BICA1-7]|nr:MAG: hypothetical protein JL50_09580 [Peptococcaceae bacterium BICA1-7]HBV95531.1 hypothetical protein [Desulfotomaculum sp.]